MKKRKMPKRSNPIVRAMVVSVETNTRPKVVPLKKGKGVPYDRNKMKKGRGDLGPYSLAA